jgi:hypothetical protein
MADILKKASDGDTKMLKWLLHFSITENPDFEGGGEN